MNVASVLSGCYITIKGFECFKQHKTYVVADIFPHFSMEGYKKFNMFLMLQTVILYVANFFRCCNRIFVLPTTVRVAGAWNGRPDASNFILQNTLLTYIDAPQSHSFYFSTCKLSMSSFTKIIYYVSSRFSMAKFMENQLFKLSIKFQMNMFSIVCKKYHVITLLFLL
jgi:hypothetical protein